MIVLRPDQHPVVLQAKRGGQGKGSLESLEVTPSLNQTPSIEKDNPPADGDGAEEIITHACDYSFEKEEKTCETEVWNGTFFE